jgi:hypothetical protein
MTNGERYELLTSALEKLEAEKLLDAEEFEAAQAINQPSATHWGRYELPRL